MSPHHSDQMSQRSQVSSVQGVTHCFWRSDGSTLVGIELSQTLVGTAKYRNTEKYRKSDSGQLNTETQKIEKHRKSRNLSQSETVEIQSHQKKQQTTISLMLLTIILTL